MDKKDKSKKIKKEKINWEDIAKRAMADLVNYKKQQEEMRGEMTQFMSLTLMHKFLSVYNDLRRALKSFENFKPKNEEDMTALAGVMRGMRSVYQKFDEIFKSEGLEKLSIESGEKFDPNTMEAISYEENENIKEDCVIDQFETGLKYKEKIIKPVKVRVSKGDKNLSC